MIGQLSHDVIGCKTRVKLSVVIGRFDLSIVSQIGPIVSQIKLVC